MTKIISSKDYIQTKIHQLTKRCLELRNQGLAPKLKVIIVGENSASIIYVKNKQLMCKKIGAEFSLVKLPADVTRNVFLDIVTSMNQDKTVTGCFVQLPVPEHLSDIDITELINPDKDVDGFHSKNVMSLYNNTPLLISCTPKGIAELLKVNDIDVYGKNVTIIGRSTIVGKPLALLLQNMNATVTVCHSKTKDIRLYTKKADIIVCAIGKANFLDSTYINDQKNQILIDVGINRDENGSLCGDTNFNDLNGKVAAITPVPGGVGPMTVISLMDNLLISTQNLILKGKK